VIYPGVDVEKFSPTGGGPAVRMGLGIPEDALVVGMLAHLSPKKGHMVLLDAAERFWPSGRTAGSSWRATGQCEGLSLRT